MVHCYCDTACGTIDGQRQIAHAYGRSRVCVISMSALSALFILCCIVHFDVAEMDLLQSMQCSDQRNRAQYRAVLTSTQLVDVAIATSYLSLAYILSRHCRSCDTDRDVMRWDAM